LVIREDVADKLAVPESGALGLRQAHQLTPDAIAPKGTSHKYGYFAYLSPKEPFLIGLDGNEAANPIAHFGDEQGMLRILLCHGNQMLLVFDRTQGAVEGGEPVFDGIVEDFAKSRRIIVTRGPDVQMRALFGSGHRVILTSGMGKWSLNADSRLGAPSGSCKKQRPTVAFRAARLDKAIPGPQTKQLMMEILRRMFMVDFWKGLLLTFRSQNPKYIYTEQYPLERPMVAERYRGAPRLNNSPETGETLCIACNLCALACPENLIVVGWQRDDATRRKVLTTFTYDTSRCMFCGLCEDACPTDCLELTQDFEMATYTREGAIWDRHRLEEGPTPARYVR